MARIRTIKPGFWTDEDLNDLPEATHMLAAQLLNYADDEGLFNANPKLIKAEVSPLREPSVSIQDSLRMLSDIGYIRLGTGEDGKRYGKIVTFSEHQRINRPTPSKISKLVITWDNAVKPHTQLTEPSREEGKGKEEEKDREGSVRETVATVVAPDPFIIPDFLDRKKRAKPRTRLEGDFTIEKGDKNHAYAKSAGMTDTELPLEASKFANHHKAKGSQMADWNAAWRTWCDNWKTFKRPGLSPASIETPWAKLPGVGTR